MASQSSSSSVDLITDQQQQDESFMKRAIELSRQACSPSHGCNHPFGALLLDHSTQTILLEAENTVITEQDKTKHAELNLCSMASRRFSREYLSEKCTLYTSTEPCIMCSGAIFWVGIGRVVYACSAQKLREIVSRKQKGENEKTSGSLTLGCHEIFEERSKGLKVQVVGPVLEEEAAAVHEEYW
ncbi:hypothetical protein FDP41_001214 [Naegleria fowleri]|uniref:CMP/dCMP-type deaminase domain-containing protein n=1 Tax=Naegleria fowleri TaxID=5763 RepID=A0A6A5BZP4_NAEFO|nr:uncharacterized protein FDP41_001214 [Naegleria fowleri]KAF0980061.1 hypothetical protein FDP41_001214 [Naegleria fowleri]CAG4719669.1 unnamed protein product [Naegleria fowleri]